MDGLQALALAKKYVANTAESLGSLRGSPCTVKGQRIDEDGNTIVTLGWTGTNGTNQTLDVKILKGTDGVVGKDGDSAFAKVEKVDDTVTITVEDKTGVTTATVKDGKNGERGATFIDAYFNEQDKLVLVLENGAELPPFSLPLAKVEISIVMGAREFIPHNAPEIDESKYATKQELTAYAKSETLEGFVKKEDGKVLVEEAKVTQIDTNKNAIGDMSKLPVAVWNDLVTAISGLYSNFMQKLEYKVSEDGKKVVEITYRSGGKVEVDVSSIITDTNIGELSDVEVEGITEGQVIAYDSSSKKFKPHTIDLTGTLKSAKDYTDEKIAESQESIAIACDEKPIHDENGDVTYKQNGVTTTVENPTSWFYYKEEEITKQTRWIDNVEFTIDVGAMKLDDYVNKEIDVVSEYADNSADATKIPDLAYIAGLKTKIQQLISAKINTSDIVDNLVSSETAKPLSAKQGKELKALIDAKPDSEDIPEVVNDLVTEATDKALSATQGKVLKGITNEILDKLTYSKSYYIDQINGSDDNDGLSAASAWKSFSASKMREGHKSLTITFCSDYTGDVALPRADFIYLKSNGSVKTINGSVSASGIGYVYIATINIKPDASKNGITVESGELQIFQSIITGGKTGIDLILCSAYLRDVTVSGATTGIRVMNSQLGEYSSTQGYTVSGCTTGVLLEDGIAFMTTGASDVSSNTTPYNASRGQMVIDGADVKLNTKADAVSNYKIVRGTTSNYTTGVNILLAENISSLGGTAIYGQVKVNTPSVERPNRVYEYTVSWSYEKASTSFKHCTITSTDNVPENDLPTIYINNNAVYVHIPMYSYTYFTAEVGINAPVVGTFERASVPTSVTASQVASRNSEIDAIEKLNVAVSLKQEQSSALKHLYNAAIASANTTTSAASNYYIRVDGIPTDYTGSTHVKSWKIRTRYNHTYELVITPWYNEGNKADRVLRLIGVEGNGSQSCVVDCAYKFSSTTEIGTMSIIFKIAARASATPFRVANSVSEAGDSDKYTWTKLGNDTATVTLEDGSTMTCADYYATFTPCQKTQMTTMDNIKSKVELTDTGCAKLTFSEPNPVSVLISGRGSRSNAYINYILNTYNQGGSIRANITNITSGTVPGTWYCDSSKSPAEFYIKGLPKSDGASGFYYDIGATVLNSDVKATITVCQESDIPAGATEMSVTALATMDKVKEISADVADANKEVSAGHYVKKAVNIANTPNVSDFTVTMRYLEIYSDTANIMQKVSIIGYDSSSQAVNKVYRRSSVYTGSSYIWSNWVES